jgi:hypothetical protein
MNSQTEDADRAGGSSRARGLVLVIVAWTLVGVPLAWGIYQTLKSAMVMFR